MDYRDNRQRWAESHQVVHFYAGQWCTFTPALTKHNKAVASNLLDQNFSAEAPNEKWAADISYIWTAQGWLYLAVMLDLYSRRVIGWAVGARMTSDLPLRALNRAIGLRQPGAGVIHHSDSEYLRAGSLGVT